MKSQTLNSALSIAILVLACSPHSEDEPQAGLVESQLVNASRDHSGEYSYVTQVLGSKMCSGTVIGCRRVLTAGHCVAQEQPTSLGGAVLNGNKLDEGTRIRIVQQSGEPPMYFTGTPSAHPAFRMTLEKRPGDTGHAKTVIYTRADLAVVTIDLEQQIPPWIKPVQPSTKAPTKLEELTLVGYGYSSCRSKVGAGIRRWGSAIVDSTELGDSFPDLFRLTKWETDEESVVIQPGDSGGPALRGDGLTMAIAGVASSSNCDSNQRFRPSSVFGESFYTDLHEYDRWVTKKTYQDWIREQVAEVCDNKIDDDCNGKTDCADPACVTGEPCCGHEGSSCCLGARCNDAGLVCDSTEKRCVVPPPVPAEVCNFMDDNNDGQADEGLDWAASGWTTVLTTANYAVYPRTITLADGRLAMSGVDSWGGGFDRGVLLVLSSAGVPVANPVWTPIGNSGGELTSLAESANGEIAALYSSTNYAGCTSGCPVYLSRVRTSDVGLTSTTRVAYSFAPFRAFDIAWTPRGYVTLVRSTGMTTHLSWLDATGSGVLQDWELPNTGMDAGSLAVSGDRAGWIRSMIGPPNRLEVGALAVDGAAEILSPTTISSSSSIVLGFRNIAWLGSELAVTWAQADDQGGRVPMGAIVTESGSVRVGPMVIGATGFYVNDLAVVDDNVVVLLVDDSGNLSLERLGPTLASIPSPNGTMQFAGLTAYSTIARTASGLALAHGYTNAFQRAFQLNLIGCGG